MFLDELNLCINNIPIPSGILKLVSLVKIYNSSQLLVNKSTDLIFSHCLNYNNLIILNIISNYIYFKIIYFIIATTYKIIIN